MTRPGRARRPSGRTLRLRRPPTTDPPTHDRSAHRDRRRTPADDHPATGPASAPPPPAGTDPPTGTAPARRDRPAHRPTTISPTGPALHPRVEQEKASRLAPAGARLGA
jgi:hypothetical protein